MAIELLSLTPLTDALALLDAAFPNTETEQIMSNDLINAFRNLSDTGLATLSGELEELVQNTETEANKNLAISQNKGNIQMKETTYIHQARGMIGFELFLGFFSDASKDESSVVEAQRSLAALSGFMVGCGEGPVTEIYRTASKVMDHWDKHMCQIETIAFVCDDEENHEEARNTAVVLKLDNCGALSYSVVHDHDGIKEHLAAKLFGLLEGNIPKLEVEHISPQDERTA